MLEARKRRLTPTGRALLGTWELASDLSPYGPEPPSEELLTCMLALPPSDQHELAEILGAKALVVHKQFGSAGGGASGGLKSRGPSRSRPFFSLAQNC